MAATDMPWHVAKSSKCPASKPWAVIKDATGEAVGCHPTQGAAQRHLAALYASEPGAASMSRLGDCVDCHGRAAGHGQTRAAVDNSAWDGPAAMSACAGSDTPASCYASICAGKKNGPTDQQGSWALPHHKAPGDPPNAAGVRNGLARLPQTQGLTNAAEAKAHLERHMSTITSAGGANISGRPAQARAEAYQGQRRGPTAEAARLEPFRAWFQREDVMVNGSQLAQLDGYASVTGAEYEMWDMFGPYGETIHPQAFDATLAASPDVNFLVNHKGLSMARTPKTLALDGDPRGLHVRAFVNPSRTDVADLLIAIDDKNVTEMSFAFMLEDGEWDEEFEHFTITRVNIDRGDVSAVNFGANPYTSIGARAREILAEFGRLPDSAQRATWERLGRKFGGAVTLGGGADAQRAAAAIAAEDVTPDPVAAAAQGRSVGFYEQMLRI